MSWSTMLDRLAGVAGLEPWYYAISGVKQETTLESKVLVLSALGFDVSSLAAAGASLARLEEEPWRRVLAPFIVTPARSPEIDLFLPAETAQRSRQVRIELEGGESATNEFRPESLPLLGSRNIDGRRIEHRRLNLGAQTPGYRRVSLTSDANAISALALTPETSHLPPRLAAGQRLWGVAAHLYTLRSDSDWGIGDFGSLARSCASTGKVGCSAIGLNPFHALFSNRPEDASPYSPSSRLFLNPLYIDIAGEASSRGVREIDELQRSASRLRASPLIDYAGVWQAKLTALQTLFANLRQQPEPPELSHFVAEQGEALEQFALFSALAETHGLPWQSWPAELRNPETASRHADAQVQERAAFHRYVQFLADGQLKRAADAATSAGMEIGVIRDLAMGISPDGADAWMNQEAHVSGLRCGAPPDDFQPKGQEWGVLPLHPLGLRRNPGPFAQLLRANMRHAGGLRIDHVIGLQRQFLVPLGAEPKTGCYVRFPFDDLLGILALESHRNRCIVVGEDLGTVPEGFRQRIHDMDIPGCAVLYFERTSDGRFKPPSDYRRKSVATVSTHDLIPLAGYWEKCDIALRRRLGMYSDEEARRAELQRDLDRARLIEALANAGIPFAADDESGANATPGLAHAVHAFLASSSAQLFLAKLDELLGEREPLNVPGTTVEVPNWRRKLPAGIDDPALRDALDELARICASYGRKA
jgi:4-alpha-glucanotransferase